jgi:hypothetical protein
MQTGSSSYLPSPQGAAPVDSPASTFPPHPAPARSYAPVGAAGDSLAMKRSSSYQPLAPPPEEPVVNGGDSSSEQQGEPEPKPSSYQPSPYGYEPPSMGSYAPPGTESQPSVEAMHPNQPSQPGQDSHQDNNSSNHTISSGGGYEPPSYQPYGYEPPSYDPEPDPEGGDGGDAASRPKKKSFMDDDGDDVPALSQQQNKGAEKSKAEKDRENEEMFRRVAEEEGRRPDPQGRWTGLCI